MERPFPIEDLVDRIGNRYAIVVAVAKRARQLKSGAKPLVEIESKNPTTIALHEISAGLVTIMEFQPDAPAPAKEELQPADLLSAAVSNLDESPEGDDADAEASTEAEAEADADSETGAEISDKDGPDEEQEDDGQDEEDD